MNSILSCLPLILIMRRNTVSPELVYTLKFKSSFFYCLIASDLLLEDAVKTHQWYESKEIQIPPDIVDFVNTLLREQLIKIDYNCGITFSCLSPKEAVNILKDKAGNEEYFDVLEADEQHSDLLPGKYEGGLKIWECTRDLVIYFMKHKVTGLKDELSGKTVLDLGCGSGILGIMCLLLGASVTFQDYNREVLEGMTLPNIFLNFDESVREKIKLYSGDWASFYTLLQEKEQMTKADGKFDYILSSETIYNPENYKKIISIIKGFLKPTGSAFIAGKTYYFGVGGSLLEFESLLVQQGLHSTLCWQTEEGISRGILEVTL